MKTLYTAALSTLSGVTVGAAVVQTLHAQAKPPVYMIAINEVSNPDGSGQKYAKFNILAVSGIRR